MPPLFAAAIGFSTAPASVSHAEHLLSLLDHALPLHFGSLLNSLDTLISRFFIACVRALVYCAQLQERSSEVGTSAFTVAVAAAADAADAVAASASNPESACVSTLHSAGLFTFLRAWCLLFASCSSTCPYSAAASPTLCMLLAAIGSLSNRSSDLSQAARALQASLSCFDLFTCSDCVTFLHPVPCFSLLLVSIRSSQCSRCQ
jgi:hypothetical protein